MHSFQTRRWFCQFLLIVAALNSFSAFAKLDREEQAVQRLLDRRQPDSRVVRELTQLHPKGPEFVDLVLTMILADPSPWKSELDRRRRALGFLAHTPEPLPWPDFHGTAIERSIQSKMRRLLEIHSKRSRNQAAVLAVMNRFALWSAPDLPFLIRKAFTPHPEAARYLQIVFSLIDQASPEHRAQVAEAIHRWPRKDLLRYTLFYRTGLMEVGDLVQLFRLLMERGLPSSGLSDNIRYVLSDLDQRWRSDDPQLRSALEILNRDLPTKLFIPLENRAEFQRYIDDFRSGKICELYLQRN